ncbi:MAG: IS256 family transposase, partial [Gemmatimonadales bacterium]|nr:IS256 family transposase [Gemmatimonadales bacterium]
PPYLRRTKSIEDLIPWLYPKGVSTGDFSEALVALLGVNAAGLSASTVSRLKETWTDEYEEWNQRDLSGKRYVYFWVDGVYPRARMEDPNLCLLVIIGADASGRKELVGVWDGFRESEQSWLELLLDLKWRGLTTAPKVAVGDGAMGCWKALMPVPPSTRHQRCWVHKTKNVLNKLPMGLQAHAKEQIHATWLAPTRKEEEASFDHFVATYDAKYPKAGGCLTRDRQALLVFYDFPGDHWRHLRTTNPIESTFATIRLRKAKTRGCLSRTTALSMVYKLALSAQRGWRRPDKLGLLTDVVGGVTFKGDDKVTEDGTPTAEAAWPPYTTLDHISPLSRGAQSGPALPSGRTCRHTHMRRARARNPGSFSTGLDSAVGCGATCLGEWLRVTRHRANHPPQRRTSVSINRAGWRG